MLAYTKIEIVQTSLHKVYTWAAKNWNKFTPSLQNPDGSLH